MISYLVGLSLEYGAVYIPGLSNKTLTMVCLKEFFFSFLMVFIKNCLQLLTALFLYLNPIINLKAANKLLFGNASLC